MSGALWDDGGLGLNNFSGFIEIYTQLHFIITCHSIHTDAALSLYHETVVCMNDAIVDL